MRLQTGIGCYIRKCIDFNSSKNVSVAIRAVLKRLETNPKSVTAEVYYYTRPCTSGPVEMGQHLADYRKAYEVWFGGVWLPTIFISLVVWFIGLLCAVLPQNTSLQSVLYLLKVGQGNHTFDNTRFVKDFPEVAEHEEGILDCFKRIRRRHPRDGEWDFWGDFGMATFAKKPKVEMPKRK
jgi:hypothetical protein